MPIFEQYSSWVFDFDGVILDSNKLKTEAFGEAVKDYGDEPAQQLMDYHVTRGGISRFVKFDYFFSDILGRAPEDGEIDQVLKNFAQAGRNGMLNCAQTPKLDELMNGPLKKLPCTVISGSMQEELREVMKLRDIHKYFAAVYGSPDNKDHIFNRELENGGIQKPAVYIGDSLYDYEMADKYGLDFIFAYDWTEFSGWEEFFKDKDVRIVKNLAELMSA